MKKFTLSTIQGKDIIIDLSKLISEEVLFINATKLALQFGKDRRQLEKFFKTKSFIEYQNALFKVIQKGDFKTGNTPLKYSIKGKYGGTYIHSDLVIVFLRWLNVDFAIQCDMYIKNTIQEIHNDKIIAKATAKANQANTEWASARDEAIKARNTLTNAIKSFCEYAELNRGRTYKKGKCPYYIKLTSLVYEVLNIQKPKGTKEARNVFNGATVEKIKYLEEMLIRLLKSHIQQKTEYHEAYKSIKEALKYEVSLLKEVA
jgi:hypothetical protein